MSIYVNNGGVWTLTKDVWVNNAGTWVEPQEVYVNQSGVWKLLHKTITIAANANNVNLFTLVGSPTSPIRLKVTVATGVLIGSSSVASPSFTIAGFPAASQILLINNGSILGAGGYGAIGTNYGSTTVNAAQAGGTALSVSSAVTIQNYGTIAGGGGGGGAGGWGTQSVTSGKTTNTYSGSGSGGGGGAGIVGGAGGAGGTGGNQPGNVGSAGANTTGGSGGTTGGTGLSGGAGGNLGTAGTTATGGNYTGPGAAAGSYAVGNVNITWEVAGTRLGAVS